MAETTKKRFLIRKPVDPELKNSKNFAAHPILPNTLIPVEQSQS